MNNLFKENFINNDEGSVTLSLDALNKHSPCKKKPQIKCPSSIKNYRKQ